MPRQKNVDVLTEIRRAMRALRRAEKFIVAQERKAHKRAAEAMQREQDRRDMRLERVE